MAGNPTMNAFLASAISANQPDDNSIRTGTVSSLDGTTLGVEMNGGVVPCGYLSNWVPQVGQTVALIRQGADWLVLGPMGGPGSPAGTPVAPAAGTVLTGEAYFTGGTTATAAGGAENIMTAWTKGGTFTFESGMLYRWAFAFGYYDTSGAAAHMCEMRLRKGFSTAGQQLAQFRRNTTAGFANIVQMGYHEGYIKNIKGSTVTTAIGASIQRATGAGSVAYYGDGNYHMTLSMEQLGTVDRYSTLATIAVGIT